MKIMSSALRQAIVIFPERAPQTTRLMVACLLFKVVSAAPLTNGSVDAESSLHDPPTPEAVSTPVWLFPLIWVICCLAFLAFGVRTGRHWEASIVGVVSFTLLDLLIMGDKARTNVDSYR